jgi:hypothetical protein
MQNLLKTALTRDMEFLESTQERDESVTAEFVKAEVVAKVTFAMSV